MANIYDAMIRHQFLIERVRLGETAKFNAVVKNIALDLEKTFSEVRYASLNKMSKREVLALQIKVRDVAAARLSVWANYILEMLEAFVEKDRWISTFAFMWDDIMPTIAAVDSRVGEMISASLLWSRVSNATVPNDGRTLKQYLDYFVSVSLARIINQIAVSRADNESSPTDALRSITGNMGDKFSSGVLRQVLNQGRAVTATIIQHASQQTQQNVQSQFFNRYRWVSVMDHRTSDICRSRNGAIYTYGSGPIPPAHPNCRSTIVPLTADPVDNSLSGWFRRQPASVQNALLGPSLARQIRENDIDVEEAMGHNTHTMSVEDFGNSAQILGD